MDEIVEPKSAHSGNASVESLKPPRLTHQFKHSQSILALIVSQEHVFAGSQAGEILKWSLESGDLVHRANVHRGSVLCLFLSESEDRLFSCAGDAIVHISCPDSLKPLFSVYSTYDVGDVFSVVHSSRLDTVYLGAQNTSIQWFDLKSSDSRPPPDPDLHPSRRTHRFFDSKGPGGHQRPRSPVIDQRSEGIRLQIDKQDIKQYAHFGYVYCMVLSHKGFGKQISDADHLISGGGDGSIKVWNLEDESGAIEELFSLDSGDVSVLALILDGIFLYSGLLEGDVHIWDLETQQLVRSIKVDERDVLCLSLDTRANCLFAGTAGGQVKKYERSQYRCVAEWQAHRGIVLSSAGISQNEGFAYITGGNDGYIKIWDIACPRSINERRLSISRNEVIHSLAEFVAYRSVSSTSQQYAEECRRAANFLRNLFRRYGASTDMLSTDGSLNPIVFAKFKGKSAAKSARKRILFYGHYDVVDAIDSKKTWIADPFKLQSINGYLYGRGVTDNKGPILAALYAAAELVATQTLEYDILFLIEGEEECGSRGLESAVQRNKHLIGEIDFVLVANSYWIDDEVPCLTYGLRGVIHATITVESEQPDRHSGIDGGALVDEPLQNLISVLATLTSSHGRVQIPGFYADIPPLTKIEESRYDAISQVLRSRNTLDEAVDSETMMDSLMRRWREPSLTIHRLKTSGPDDGAVIPCHTRAALSLRLVPNQDLVKISGDLTRYVIAQFDRLQTKNKLSISIDQTAEPWLGDPDNEIFRALEKAIIEVWQLDDTITTTLPSVSPRKLKASRKAKVEMFSLSDSPSASPRNGLSTKSRSPLYIREGGSIGGIRFLEKAFGAPAAQFPCGQASDKAHLDNERLRLKNLTNAGAVFRKVFRGL
ncbi:MAG: hypothetical protein M1814_005843 [Vezdaea aestivalis]|nr:MAG: hypothetical protein M1814_005843 [Vezdaea aestivalis]